MNVNFEITYKPGFYDRLVREEKRCAFLSRTIQPSSQNGFVNWEMLRVGDEVSWFQSCDPDKNYQGEDEAIIEGVVTERHFCFYPRNNDRSIGDVLTIRIEVNKFE